MMKKWIKGMALALGLSLTMVTPLKADYEIDNDYGGSVTSYMDKYQKLEQDGVNLRFDGLCYSGCTLVLAYFDRSRVCVTKNSVFGFHSAWVMKNGKPAVATEFNTIIWNMLKPWAKQTIKKHGFDLTSPDLAVDTPPTMIKGSEFYPLCEDQADTLPIVVINKE